MAAGVAPVTMHAESSLFSGAVPGGTAEVLVPPPGGSNANTGRRTRFEQSLHACINATFPLLCNRLMNSEVSVASHALRWSSGGKKDDPLFIGHNRDWLGQSNHASWW